MMGQSEQKPHGGRLQRVIKGKIERPVRVVLMGTDGLGKSTWASKAPAPAFIGAEDGTAQLDVERMPDVHTWRDILDTVDELALGEHSYRTVVIDTADWAEPLCWAHVAQAAKKPDIEALPYGKGYVAALDQWRVLISKLERCRARGMNIIILAHVWVKTFKPPQAEISDFDRYEMKLHPKASGLLREWADCVLFGEYETFSNEVNGRMKGVSENARVVRTQRTAAYDAKNRYDLPATLPLEWADFEAAVKAHRPADPAVLRANIDKMLATEHGSAFAERVLAALDKAGDNAAELAKIANHLTAQINLKAREQGR